MTTFATPATFAELKSTLEGLFQQYHAVEAVYLKSASDPIVWEACRKEMSAISARTTPLMEQISALVP
jgi:hypothetical protein